MSATTGIFVRRLGVAVGVLVAFAAALYLAAVAYLYINQRHILYTIRPVPATRDTGGLPIREVTILTPDGGTLDMGKWRYIRMHKQGVGYLAVSYRGYSGSTGSPTEQGLFTDGLAAYDWLKTQGYKADGIVIHGHSLGTGVATYVAGKRGARALVLEAPFTATVDVASERYPFVPVSWLMKDQFRSRDRIKDVHVPLLVIHGDRDSVVPFHQGQRLFAMANGPKTFIRMPGSEHNTLTRDGAYEHIWTFLGLKAVPHQNRDN
jgi:fermentation-respiration switch protein FrsA (DUF1100 family)